MDHANLVPRVLVGIFFDQPNSSELLKSPYHKVDLPGRSSAEIHPDFQIVINCYFASG
jgi:hypothetical protein